MSQSCNQDYNRNLIPQSQSELGVQSDDNADNQQVQSQGSQEERNEDNHDENMKSSSTDDSHIKEILDDLEMRTTALERYAAHQAQSQQEFEGKLHADCLSWFTSNQNEIFTCNQHLNLLEGQHNNLFTETQIAHQRVDTLCGESVAYN